MALVLISKEFANEPSSMKALQKAFSENVEQITPSDQEGTLYKIFRVQGGGVPKDDTYIAFRMVQPVNSNVPRINEWWLADPVTKL